jgi:hypothetical protein
MLVRASGSWFLALWAARPCDDATTTRSGWIRKKKQAPRIAIKMDQEEEASTSDRDQNGSGRRSKHPGSRSKWIRKKKQAPRIAIGADQEDRAEAATSCAGSGPVHGHVNQRNNLIYIVVLSGDLHPE